MIAEEQRKHHLENNEARYVGVLCDKHQFAEMTPVKVTQGRGNLVCEFYEGFRCSVPSCKRFFGTMGYADMIENTEFENLLNGPGCPQFSTLPMYLQKVPESGLIRWVCAQCNEERPGGEPIVT